MFQKDRNDKRGPDLGTNISTTIHSYKQHLKLAQSVDVSMLPSI